MIMTHWQNNKNTGGMWGYQGMGLLKVTKNSFAMVADEVYEITAQRQH